MKAKSKARGVLKDPADDGPEVKIIWRERWIKRIEETFYGPGIASLLQKELNKSIISVLGRPRKSKRP